MLLRPSFAVTPSFCQSNIDGPISDSKVPTTDCVSDPSCFNIPTIPTLDPVNPGGNPPPPCVDYPVTHTITVTAKNGAVSTRTVTTTVSVCNPCLNDDYVWIEPPARFSTFEYIIYSGSQNMPAHGDFTVQTRPYQHNLCGAFRYVPTYTTSPVPYDDTLTQVTYNSVNKVFSYDSDDMSLLLSGVTRTREVYVEFVNYPVTSYPAVTYPNVQVPNARQEGPIVFLDPCANRHSSFSFTWANQVDRPAIKYTNLNE